MKVKRIKLDNLIFFVMALLPLILAFIWSLSNMGATNGTGTLTAFINEFTGFINNINTPLKSPMLEFYNLFDNITNDAFMYTIICYVAYLGTMYFVKLIFTSIIFIPKFACTMIERVERGTND